MAPIPYQTKVSRHPGSTKEEILRESTSSSNHRFGTLNQQRRIAGSSGIDDLLQDDDIEEAAEGRADFQNLNEKLKGKHNLFTVRDVIQTQLDWSQKNPPQHPISARYVLAVTETEIKGQKQWPANVKAREAEERKRICCKFHVESLLTWTRTQSRCREGEKDQ